MGLGNYPSALGQVAPTGGDLAAAVEKADIEAQAAAAQRRAEEEREGEEQAEFVRKKIWVPVALTGVGILALWGWAKWRER